MSKRKRKKPAEARPVLGVAIAPEARAFTPAGLAFIERKLAEFAPLPALSLTVKAADQRGVRFSVSTPSRRATIIKATVGPEPVHPAVAFARPSCVFDWEQKVWACPDPLLTLDEHLCEVLSAGCALAKTGEKTARHDAVALVQQQAPGLNVVAYATKGPVEWFTRATRIQPGDADEAVVLHGAWAIFWYLKRRKKLANVRRSPVAAATLAIAWLSEFRFAQTGEALALGKAGGGYAEALDSPTEV